MFGWFKRRKADRVRSEANAVRDSLMARVLAKYDAAETNDDNKKHWSKADGLSASAANSLAVRSRLRSRARYECANNCYANGMVRTLAYHGIGTGPILSIDSDDDHAREVEDRWLEYSEAIGLADKLRQMREARARDGEAFALIVTNNAIRSPVQVDLAVFEADRVTDQTSPMNYGRDARNYADGITFDRSGNATLYNVLRDHPGDLWATTEADPIAANYVVHWFRADRPGQRRGIPEITPAIPLYAILRRYTLAVLQSAEVAALMALFLKTTSAAIDPASVDPYDLIDVERNTMMTLPDGWDVQQLEPRQPSTTYDAFSRTVLREIARCLDMPFNIAAGDSSGYNYSSGRLDHQTYWRAMAVDRQSCERVVLGPLFDHWYDDGLLTPGYFTRPRTKFSRLATGWDWPPMEHVDPEKESRATSNDLSFALSSLPTEHARRGRRWDRELTRQARALGLTLKELQARLVEKLYGNNQQAPVDPNANNAANDPAAEPQGTSSNA